MAKNHDVCVCVFNSSRLGTIYSSALCRLDTIFTSELGLSMVVLDLAGKLAR